MKVKVIQSFIDKEIKAKEKDELKAVREIGSLFDCTEARFKEIQKAGNYVEVVKEPVKKAIEK